MRILLACEFYYPSVGGVQEVIRQVAEGLVAKGHAVTVATSHMAERPSRVHNGVAIEEFRVSGNTVRGMSGDVDGYRQYLVAGDYDVLMVKAAQQWTFDAMVAVLDQIPRPKVFIPCGFSSLYEPAYGDYFREMPEALAKFDHLIFYASDYRDVNMARDHGLTSFSIVPNGASRREFEVPRDPEFRGRMGIAEEAFVVLTVGRPGYAKGHWDLANAFALADFGRGRAALIMNGTVTREPRKAITPRRVARACVELVRPYARPVKRFLLRKPPWPKDPIEPIKSVLRRVNRARPAKVAMVKDLPRAEVVQAYLNSDLFVFASHIEYSPLVLYEAAAAGLPFLTVPVGNAQEIAEWTGGGVVCPAARDERGYTQVDPAVLAEKISGLAADRPLLANLGQTGHQAWLERFTWETIVDKYEAIFTDLVRRAGA